MSLLDEIAAQLEAAEATLAAAQRRRDALREIRALAQSLDNPDDGVVEGAAGKAPTPSPPMEPQAIPPATPAAPPSTPAPQYRGPAGVRWALEQIGRPATAREIQELTNVSKGQLSAVLHGMLKARDLVKAGAREREPGQAGVMPVLYALPEKPAPGPEPTVSNRVQRELQRENAAAQLGAEATAAPIRAKLSDEEKRIATITTQVEALIATEPGTAKDIAKKLIRNQHDVAGILRDLERRGRAHRAQDGTWHQVLQEGAAA